MRALFGRVLLLFVGLVRWPLRAWVRPRVTPTDLKELALDDQRRICYVLAGTGLSDWLALEMAVAAQGLPRPHPVRHRLPADDRALVLALPEAAGRGRTVWQRMIRQGMEEPESGIQIVPVSIFWGQNPVKETSLFRILFADTERPGRLRKLLIILAQGRNTLLHFGQPLDYGAFAGRDVAPEVAVRKLSRVLRVHFRRQRAATLGPTLSHRGQVINSVLADPEVRAVIERTARAENVSVAAIRARARSCADEIAADYSNIAIGFMLRVLSWLWHRIYDGVEVAHLQRLRDTAHDASLVYLPSHRSHMDYLLVSYILYQEGFALPQIAAGINLDFWPVGGLLRRCGAFYLRRSFRGDKLYTAVFRSYVDVLIGRGQPMKFYPEGGRSRTGRLLPPKTGMLAMVAGGLLHHPDRPVALVPVYIGYDRVMEVNSYFEELSGTRPKKGESVRGLLRSSRKVLSRKYGRAHIAFGEPLRLDQWADRHRPGWRRELPAVPGPSRPDWLAGFVDDVAETVMVRINAAASLNAAGLVSLILLGSPQKAVAEHELIHGVEALLALARACPYSPDVRLPSADGAALLAEAEPLVRLQRHPHAWGDVLTLAERDAVLLTYTRNNVMHLFALPSLLANFFAHAETCSRAGVLRDAEALYPLLASELFLRWPADGVASALEAALDGMLTVGLLTEDEHSGDLRRPAVGTREFAALIGLARIMRETLERYGMTAVLLANSLDSGHIERGAFERQCQLMAERMAILTGRNSPEFFDLRLFRNHLQTLKRDGLLTGNGGSLRIDPRMRALAEHALQLLGPDIRQTILHLTSQPTAEREAQEPASS